MAFHLNKGPFFNLLVCLLFAKTIEEWKWTFPQEINYIQLAFFLRVFKLFFILFGEEKVICIFIFFNQFFIGKTPQILVFFILLLTLKMVQLEINLELSSVNAHNLHRILFGLVFLAQFILCAYFYIHANIPNIKSTKDVLKICHLPSTPLSHFVNLFAKEDL